MKTNKHTLVAVGVFAALLTLGMATAEAKSVTEVAPRQPSEAMRSSTRRSMPP